MSIASMEQVPLPSIVSERIKKESSDGLIRIVFELEPDQPVMLTPTTDTINSISLLNTIGNSSQLVQDFARTCFVIILLNETMGVRQNLKRQ